MLKLFRQRVLKGKDKGATAVEYGLMVALIAAVIIIIVTALGLGLQDKFDEACEAIADTSCEVGP